MPVDSINSALNSTAIGCRQESLSRPAAGSAADASAQTCRGKDQVELSGKTGKTGKPENSQPGDIKSPTGEPLSEDEKKQVEELKRTDAKVRAHEQAHISAAGGLSVSGANFSYQNGPDGKRYAVGGEVSIDTSEGKTPEETIRKAEQIRRAAMAPADPSPQDRAVAAQASQMAAQAKAEKLKETAEKGSEATPSGIQAGEQEKASSAYRNSTGKADNSGLFSIYA
ncbi:MAG: putative metalloprotease CJM1_0395 family protein [Candidatus Wallbacteria bacterium]|nr:putative metalloprotease CJM1_0395 family protein [Candidatus Wallbacteria bacterium]